MMWHDARFKWWADFCKINVTWLVLGLLTACSGGETGTGMAGKGTPGAGGQTNNNQQVVVGEITGFGSVFVNGIEFNIESSTVQVGNNKASESDLAVGMVVSVYGDVNDNRTTGTANLVAFENEVEGEVLANNYPASLNVMGQTILFDNDTIFKSNVPGISAIKDIRKKDRVEISGFPTHDGTIYATRIKLTGQVVRADYAMVKGRIESLSLATHQFVIGGMPVSYDAATNIQSSSDLKDGLLVKVTSSQPLNGNRPLYAEQIEAYQAHDYNLPGAAIELEGAVSTGLLNNQFQLNGMTVQVSNTTQILVGTLNNVVPGQKVRVKGSLDSTNTLIADQILIIKPSSLGVTAPVETIDYMAGTVTVLGQVFQANAMTIMNHDPLSPSEAFFNLNQLSPGDVIEIKGYQNSNEIGFTATSVERSTNATSSVEGVIDAVQNSTLQIGPFTIDVSQLPTGQFKDTDVGRKVELSIEYDAVTGVMVATAYEYDN